MRKSIFIFILLLLITTSAVATVVDLIQLDDTTHNYTGGTGFYSIDGNWSTSQRASYSGTDGGGGCSVTSEHIFAHPHDIENIKYRLRIHAFDDGRYSRHRNYHVYIQTRDIDGNWTTVPGTESSGWEGGSGSLDHDSGIRELTGINITNVTGIKAYAGAGSSAAGGEGRFDGYAEIFEIQTYGVFYNDIGLRVKTETETIKIGVEDLDDTKHKLRIRKGNTTYGIPLVEVDSSNASPVRIYDGSSVKALPKTD